MFKYLLLGITQGLTEFLPVSSSGHLVLLQQILQIKEQQLFTIVILHLATLLAMVIYFFKDILRAIKDLRLVINILVTTFITGIIAILWKDFFTRAFSSLKMLAVSFLVTGLILLLTKRIKRGEKGIKEITLTDAFILGVTQAIAIIPAISRSGITISALLFRKVDKEAAFKFSFLASIPAVVGAFILEMKEINFNFSFFQPQILWGFFSALIFGLISLYVLKTALKKAKFHYFGYYCIIIAVLSWIFLK
jgi:undecaprenyl-diphosphatase